MATFRIHKTNNYTVMSNEHLRNKALSLKAKGLLSLMLSLPDDWDYSVLGLAALSKDGKDSVMSTLSELKDAGYVKMSQSKSNNGRFGSWDYDVYESSVNGNPNSEKPYAENPNTENPPQLNTNNINNISSINSRIINNTPNNIPNININNKTNTNPINTPSIPHGEVESVSNEELMFEEFRKAYLGTKRGLRTEFENFKKKHKDWREVLPILKVAYEQQIAAKQSAKGSIDTRYEKHLQTYINNRCWEEEVSYEHSKNNSIKHEESDAAKLKRAIEEKWVREGWDGSIDW